MSLWAEPELLGSAATDLASLGSKISAAHAAALAPTTGVLAAGTDEVSTAIAALFSAHGQGFQALSAQAAAFHSQFVQALNAGAGAYGSAEAANAGSLRTLAQDLPVPNDAVSVNGYTLFQSGTATASSSLGNIAIAAGGHSSAVATGGGILNSAIALGGHSHAGVTGGGILNSAIAISGHSLAVAGNGNLDTAIAFRGSSSATAAFGNLDLACAVGTLSTADAGGSMSTAGSGDLAFVLGDMLSGAATGGNLVVHVVTPIFTLGGIG